ncbi:hypothetical protein Hanom_Chr04g00384321 [Helianthus anomalus]
MNLIRRSSRDSVLPLLQESSKRSLSCDRKICTKTQNDDLVSLYLIKKMFPTTDTRGTKGGQKGPLTLFTEIC